MKRLLLLLPLLLVVTLAAEPTLPPAGAAALSTVVRTATDRGDVPGAVVAVVNRTGLIYHEAFGSASTLTRQPMAKDTIFNMASMTKPVTSVGIMMLIDEGKLRLDDDVATYLPKYRNPVVVSRIAANGEVETRPARRSITIRHLLTHTSGIGYTFSNATVAKLVQQSRKQEPDLPLLFDPGDGWAYGASTRVLGDVIEKVSGQKLDAFLTERILAPLGMTDTSYLVPPEKYSRVVGVNARGDDGKFVERPRPATLAASVAGDGGLYGTAGDYSHFLQMLLNRGQYGGKRLLSERAVGLMFQNQTGRVTMPVQQSTNQSLSRNFPAVGGKDHWGLGFQLAAEQRPNRRSPASGTWAGIFNTHFFIDPRKEIGVVIMMQTLPFYDEASMKVYDAVEEVVYRNLK
jgi:CubicO group peptidase (beta-lactamase class C family)